MTKAKSRSDNVKWLTGDCAPDILGEGEGDDLMMSHYKQSQLPTNRNVLKHVFHLKKAGRHAEQASL